MSHAFDLVVRNGLVVDGSGGERFEADVAVKDGRIAEIGRVSGAGAEREAPGERDRPPPQPTPSADHGASRSGARM